MARGFASTDEPVIGAIEPWFGSKRNIAPRIAEALGPHSAYWDLGCGSLAMLLAKLPASMETACDLHGDLTNLARVIQHPTEGLRFYRRLRRTLACEGLFDDALESLALPCPDEIDPDRAHAYFVASWLGRNGTAGTEDISHSLCVRYTTNGGQPAKRWQSAIQSIPAWSRRLRNVFILRRDLFEVLGKIDDAEHHAIYIDPPYLTKGARYLHDFKRTDPTSTNPLIRKFGDHGRLALAVRGFKHARIVVSYYDSPELAELYPDWEHRKIEVSKATSNASKRDERGATKAVEVLLINQRPQRAARSLFAEEP